MRQSSVEACDLEFAMTDCLGTATTSISTILTIDSSFFDVFFLNTPLIFPSLWDKASRIERCIFGVW